jgi:hypothetical protein
MFGCLHSPCFCQLVWQAARCSLDKTKQGLLVAGERASDLRGISEGTAPGISHPASPRDEGDRDTVGFQAARREIDNERPNLVGATIFEPRRHRVDVLRRQGAGLRIGVAEGAMDKGREVAPNKRGIFLGETGAKITIATTSEQELGLVSGCL